MGKFARIMLLCLAVLLVTTAIGFAQTTEDRINNLVNAGIRGSVLQSLVMTRADGICLQNRPYIFNGVQDCYGYCRQVWNAILNDGTVHPEDFYPNAYDRTRWLGLPGGIPVDTYVDATWGPISELGGTYGLLPGDLVGTVQGHTWGGSVHYGMAAGIGPDGTPWDWDCHSTPNDFGAEYRPFYGGFAYYYKPIHNALAYTRNTYKAKPVLFRASNNWLLRNTLSGGGAEISFAFGSAGDTPLMGDWDGNGSITCGTVRVVAGQLEWHLRNSNSAGPADLVFPYGVDGDIPIVGDWDGNGVWSIGVIRGNEWLLRNVNSPGTANLDFGYGTTGDVFVTGDWDGNGTFTPGVKRGSNTWLLRNSNSSGGADYPSFGFGTTGDKPIVGDWDGNGTWTIGMIRGSNSWLCRNTNNGGSADVTFAYGTTGDKMLVWH